ncbi:MAG: hypothetical protein NC131_08070 [Roseburia sp.]|nr:hypothetical protein [Roseburia sp.]
MIKRVYKSELKRIFSDKRMLIIFAVIAVIFIILISVTVVQWGNGIMNLHPVSAQARAKRIAGYQAIIDYNKAWCDYLSGVTQTCPDEIVSVQYPYETYYRSLKEYEYLLKTQTVREDYYCIDFNAGSFPQYGNLWLPFGLNNYQQGGDNRLISNSFEFLKEIYTPAIIIGVLITFFQCELFKFGKQRKNYYAANVDDRGIYAGRYLVCICIIVTVWSVIAFWGACFSFGSKVNKVLYYFNGEMHAESVYLLYFSVALSMLAAMLSASALTSFLSTAFSKIWQYGLLTVAAFLALEVVFILLKYFVPEKEFYGGIPFFPILGLKANACYFYFGWQYWLIIILNLIFAAALVIAKIFILKRKDKTDRENV